METIRINFEFPREAYPYLRLLCAKKGLSLRSFATQALLKAMEECEDAILTERAEALLKRIEEGEEELVSWKDAKKRLGYVRSKNSPLSRKRTRKVSKKTSNRNS